MATNSYQKQFPELHKFCSANGVELRGDNRIEVLNLLINNFGYEFVKELIDNMSTVTAYEAMTEALEAF